MRALIEYICTNHERLGDASLKVTLHEGTWAVCPGERNDGHDWLRIEPTRAEYLGDLHRFKKPR